MNISVHKSVQRLATWFLCQAFAAHEVGSTYDETAFFMGDENGKIFQNVSILVARGNVLSGTLKSHGVMDFSQPFVLRLAPSLEVTAVFKPGTF